MTAPSEAITLLRLLGSGVVPTDRAPTRTDARSLDFASLLDKARGGELRSGLTVTVDPDLNVTLPPEEIETLSRVADIAQAQGIDRVLVLHDNQRFVLDVERRVLSQRLPARDGELITGFGAVVQLPLSAPDAQIAPDEAQPLLSGERLLQMLRSLNASTPR
ncbi:MAG: hypothetical protein Kow0022_01220 [Phycisphaerales bacterium]